KRDESLILPTNNSLSLTLDGFYTETTVRFSEQLEKDRFFLDSKEITGVPLQRVTAFLNIVRIMVENEKLFVKVNSVNHVLTAACLASSASEIAALAAASSLALNLNLNDEELSRLTRQGSGSACRSIYEGFAEFQ